MKLTIDRKRLAEALGAVAGMVERRVAIPILSHILLRADGSDLVITGTDLQITVRSVVEAEVEQAGAVCVPAHVLADAASRFSSETVSLALDKTRDRLTASGGRSRVQLATLPAEDFPQPAASEFPLVGDVDAADLLELIEGTSFAISSEEARYYLCGLFLHAAKAGTTAMLAAVATDGHRLARRAVIMNGLAGRWPQHGTGAGGVLIPQKTLHLVTKLAKGWTSLHVRISGTVIEVTAGPTVVTSRLIDGTFPDYEKVIPNTSGARRITVDRDALAEAVRRVSVASDERGGRVALDLADGTLGLSAGGAGVSSSRADDAIDATLAGAPVRIGASARYLAEMLDAHGLDEATLHVIDAGSPIVVPGAGPLDVQVLMPMRVDEA